MKHPTLGFLLVAFVSPILMAQTNTYPFPSSGNVGIGTTSPSSSAPLHIFSSADADRYIRVENPSSGGSALAGLSVLNGSGSMAYFFLTGTGYTGISAWGNKLVIGTDSGITGGMLLRPATGGFRVSADGLNNPNLVVTTAGKVGIGTSTPLQPLSVIGPPNATALFNVGKEGDYYGSWMGGSQGNNPHMWVGDWYSAGGGLTWDSSAGKLLLDTYSSSQHLLIANNGGNVGIGVGTTNPTHKLAVNGSVRATEIIVDTGWADYVFADDYRLAPLAEVEAHIKEHKHLPGIPSAAEVSERGVSVGEMQALMMAKIEELTLHSIAQEKRNDALQSEVARLRTELASLSPSK